MRLASVNQLFQLCQTVVRRITQSISYLLGPQTSSENTIARMSEMARQFEERHGFSQCIEAIEGTHIGIKKPLENAANYFERKETYTMSIQACADFKYCFFDVVIRWPGSVNDAGVFSNSA